MKRRIALEWSEFAQRFALELATLDRDTILIVREHDESRHYVQAMREPDRLYAESVSNNFLDGALLLKPSDEEILSEAGWRPPTADWSPANWWTELPPDPGPAAFALLADMMVTALRDVQGVRRPLDLVYESFHRHGTGQIELPRFGITSAHQAGRRRAPAPIAAPTPAREPTREAPREPTIEDVLTEARRKDDHVAYFDVLIFAELLLPLTGAGQVGYRTVLHDGAVHVLAFTSPAAQDAAGYAGPHHRTDILGLAGGWPDPTWQLTVNPGLPSEIRLDAANVQRLAETRRGAERAAAADAQPLPPAPGLPIRLPHGAQLWSDTGMIAVFDGVSGRWNQTSRTQ
ncbi:SseB family protein [Actinocorallia sp. API 0066]|uniref:TY-Chap domain-containing protein n=1 Tax=Actinocorallia sp. API 0066 TaxID=2896846 RepID=UPI001E49D149|nr:SseB family protein [Actinocorallia sp. API 0066]MCD0451828.1 SseB family protein [Actinocorallia sp. API 0066]